MEWARLLLCIAIAEGAGLLGSLATRSSVDEWYRKLKKPQRTPPSWLFAPVWIILYLLMGIALYYVWGDPLSMTFFSIQLVLNVLWSVLFFGMRKPGAALIEIIVLWLAIFLTASLFFNAQPLAGWLMLPYLGWTGFAAYLNYSIWRLNQRA